MTIICKALGSIPSAEKKSYYCAHYSHCPCAEKFYIPNWNYVCIKQTITILFLNPDEHDAAFFLYGFDCSGYLIWARTIIYVSLCVWLILFSMASLIFIHLVAYIRISFPLWTEYFPSVYAHHVLFIQHSFIGVLGYSYIVGTRSCGVQVSTQVTAFISLAYILGFMVVSCLIFCESTIPNKISVLSFHDHYFLKIIFKRLEFFCSFS